MSAAETVELPAAEWNALMFWLGRCEDKGELDRCPDLVKAMNALIKAMSAYP